MNANALKDAMVRADAADAAGDANTYELDLNALRAIAHNAVYEAMQMRGRTRFSPLDALRADLVFRALADTPASNVGDLVRTAVLPSLKAGATPMLSNMAEAVDRLNSSETDTKDGDANQAGSAGQAA